MEKIREDIYKYHNRTMSIYENEYKNLSLNARTNVDEAFYKCIVEQAVRQVLLG